MTAVGGCCLAALLPCPAAPPAPAGAAEGLLTLSLLVLLLGRRVRGGLHIIHCSLSLNGGPK